MLLKGKNVVITGAGRGIGREVAKACAKEGANVGLISRTLEELNQTKKEIENLGANVKVSVKAIDITKYPDVEKAFKEINQELGPLNGVIANAGASGKAATHEFDPIKFSDILNVNVLGVFNTFKAAFPFLKKDDKKDNARFIITGSAAYPNAMPMFAAYTATKYAIVGFQKSISLEYKRENITFNSVLPTMVDTKLLRGKKAGDGTKPDNIMNPWELNEFYLFLLSEAGNRISDELITTSDFEAVKKAISEAPADKKQNWETFKGYLEEKSPKIYGNVKKLGKLIELLMKKE